MGITWDQLKFQEQSLDYSKQTWHLGVCGSVLRFANSCKQWNLTHRTECNVLLLVLTNYIQQTMIFLRLWSLKSVQLSPHQYTPMCTSTSINWMTAWYRSKPQQSLVTYF